MEKDKPTMEDIFNKIIYRKCLNCEKSFSLEDLDEDGLCPQCLEEKEDEDREDYWEED